MERDWQLKKVTDNNKPGRKILNVNRLKEPEIKQKFVIELRNRFRVLEDLDQTEDNSIEKKRENIKEVNQNTSEKIIGFRKSSSKQWLTSDTWKAVDERAKLKEKVLSTRSSRLKEQTQKKYIEKDKEVKKRARKDKMNHLEERAEEAEKAAARGDLSTVYKITKELCEQCKQPPPVKDKNGKIITTEREQAARWVEHFKAVLNRPEPINEFQEAPQLEELDINTDPPSKEEITKAIKSMKSGKAAGIDGLQAELLKADINTATAILHDLFKDIWEENKIPEDWETDWFEVQSGVRQGCIISPILFLVAIDWVMRKTTSDKKRGITWSMFTTLEDLDFADDIALLSSKQDHM
ncbi:uncharacterized protein LOC143070963 [Mytilus galloprovincialis]|uniref:uncharacterized protein LOC143070963 n=1 Tax=Mytilus galloprovincialis TaxID=29158 RepID=UPI003F7C1416